MDKYLRKNLAIATLSRKMSGSSEEKGRLNLHDLQRDPGLRTTISKLDPNSQDEIWKTYFQMGPFQPQSHDFIIRRKITMICPELVR